MNTNQTESDLLRALFRRLPEEKLSSAFQQEMMMRIQKEAIRTRRRNRILLIAAYTFALALFAGLTITTYIYLEIPKIEIEIPRISVSGFYIFLGVISIVLLLADYIFRRSFYKRHPDLE
ncbi:MAG: hypothetical protein LBV72_20150 [Tannerella sp.]|jgi:polyferredoxin|nr:hypothetical protein [Tannerella sp.]